MSLVVGAIDKHNAALVADTKLTYDTAGRGPAGQSAEKANRHEYESSLPKIVVLDGTLAVGYAGFDAVAHLMDIVALRGQRLDGVLDTLSTINDAQFVVLSSKEERVQLWQVRDGKPDDRTMIGRAWAGDEHAYDVFRDHWRRMSDESVEFVASASMQFPMSFSSVHTVGGFMSQVRLSHKGLHFVPHPVAIAPHRLQLGSSNYQGRTLTLHYVVPDGVDPTGTFISSFAGYGDTVGASGHLILPANWGLLFPHDQPWVPITIHAASVEEFASLALERHGQYVHGAENPYW